MQVFVYFCSNKYLDIEGQHYVPHQKRSWCNWDDFHHGAKSVTWVSTLEKKHTHSILQNMSSAPQMGELRWGYIPWLHSSRREPRLGLALCCPFFKRSIEDSGLRWGCWTSRMEKKKGFEAFCYISPFMLYLGSVVLPTISGAMAANRSWCGTARAARLGGRLRHCSWWFVENPRPSSWFRICEWMWFWFKLRLISANMWFVTISYDPMISSTIGIASLMCLGDSGVEGSNCEIVKFDACQTGARACSEPLFPYLRSLLSLFGQAAPQSRR